MSFKNLTIKEIPSYTIDQLDFIITNDHHFSTNMVKASKAQMSIKLEELRNINLRVVRELDGFIRQQGWYDFHVWSYDAWNLVVGGNHSLSYSHSLEITFNQTFFVSGILQTWHSNTDHSVIEMIQGDLEIELNIKYEIEQYHQLFVMRTEDYKNDFIIAARSISFEIDSAKMMRKPNK